MSSALNKEAPNPGLEVFELEFYEDRLKEFESLKQHMLDSEYENIRKLAHKWKGFCGPYGFKQLEVLSQKLEISSQNKDSAEIKTILQEMSNYLDEKGRILGKT